MTNFQTMMQQDALNVFANTDEFGETFVYNLQNGSHLTITAVVDRDPPEKSGATARGQVNPTVVHIPRGLLSSRPVPSGDTITISGKTQTVVKILDESDMGMWHLQIQ